MKRIALVLAALSCAAPALAQTTGPDWRVKPTEAQIGRVYPEEARKLKMSATVVVRCAVTLSGAPHNCIVREEMPVGYGFGDAALTVIRTASFVPAMKDGQPVDGAVVSVPIYFQIRKPTFGEMLLGAK